VRISFDRENAPAGDWRLEISNARVVFLVFWEAIWRCRPGPVSNTVECFGGLMRLTDALRHFGLFRIIPEAFPEKLCRSKNWFFSPRFFCF
jgi:hypothetical protein